MCGVTIRDQTILYNIQHGEDKTVYLITTHLNVNLYYHFLLYQQYNKIVFYIQIVHCVCFYLTPELFENLGWPIRMASESTHQ